MDETTQPLPARPELAWRIGITGTRDIEPAEALRLDRQLRELLRLVRGAIATRTEANQPVAAAYRRAHDGTPAPCMRFISPLARGADRLGARAAVAEGYSLHVPMPFPRAIYEQDFDAADDLVEFRALLDHAWADWLELDGDRATAPARSYEAAGRYVVRNCDLLVAIWDGAVEGNGRGGTADIVRYAAATGVPIWWLHPADDRAPVWLADIQDIRDPRQHAASAEAALREHLGAVIDPPRPCQRHRHGLTERAAHLMHSAHVTPMQEYFTSPPPSSGRVWRAYDWVIKAMAGLPGKPPPPEGSAPEIPKDPVAAYWFARFFPADRRAIRYADRYRSGYVWTFLFATLSVAAGACAQAWGLTALAPVLRERLTLLSISAEFAVLLLILLLVAWGLRREWHEHSIECRLLAELCRKQQALGPLGYTLPITDVRTMADADDVVPERGAWVAWLFAAEQRAAPFPTGVIADAAQGAPRRMILDELIATQRAYHLARMRRDGAAGRRMAAFGEWIFIAVLVLVAGKLVFAAIGTIAWVEAPFGLAATVLPACSAAFVGIRAYSELPLLALQSRHMEVVLKSAHGRVDRLGSKRPLLSQDLGAEAAAVATLMLQDLDGWARLFRVKSLETG